MKSYDVIVVGAGDVGLGIAFRAAAEGLSTALIDKGNVGGTCVNSGCVPSKTLICTADRIMEAAGDLKLGIKSARIAVDFRAVMERMRRVVMSGRKGIQEGLAGSENLEFLNQEGRFLDEHTLEVGADKIRGKKIFIASGARPALPPLKGLNDIAYLTNESVLELKKKPASLIFIGGGYIALEYAHFFSALGVKVSIVDRNKTFLRFGEPEISELLQAEMAKRVDLQMGVETLDVRAAGGGYALRVKDIGTGRKKELLAEAVMVSAGRRSNADILQPEKAGIELDKANFVKVDQYLRTNRKYIWALGDAIGRAMFTHAGDKEAEIAWHNATQRKKIPMNFEVVPYAVFTYPQIASVGLTEEQAGKEGREILVGRARYSDTVMGEALGEFDGLAKAVVAKDSGKILGFHIIGPQAAILIQEVVNAMTNGADVNSITGAMHIFPALSDIITETLGNLE